MKSMFIHCPNCDQDSELFLSSKAFMIIMNCPNCQKPLMYYYGKTFAIEDIEIEKLYKNDSLKNISEFLKSLQTNKLRSAKTIKKPVLHRDANSPNHQPGAPVREEFITNDDILNLKIDIARSCSVEDFLKNI
jgi:hypothetical protein